MNANIGGKSFFIISQVMKRIIHDIGSMSFMIGCNIFSISLIMISFSVLTIHCSTIF